MGSSGEKRTRIATSKHCRRVQRDATHFGLHRGGRHSSADQTARLYARSWASADLGHADGLHRHQRGQLHLTGSDVRGSDVSLATIWRDLPGFTSAGRACRSNKGPRRQGETMTVLQVTRTKTSAGETPSGRLFLLELSGDRIHSMNADGLNRRTIVTGFPNGSC